MHWAATGARAGIGDYSSVTEFALSAELVRTLARQGSTHDGTYRTSSLYRYAEYEWVWSGSHVSDCRRAYPAACELSYAR